MAKIRRALLGASLALTVGLAAAGPATWPVTAQNVIEYPECAQASKLMQHTADVSQSVDVAMEQAVPEAVDELIDEYLSFHAQVVEEGGKLSLVPGSRLRTHSN